VSLLAVKSDPPVGRFGIKSDPPVGRISNVSRFVFSKRNQRDSPEAAHGRVYKREKPSFSM
jgi:hypothetical protein